MFGIKLDQSADAPVGSPATRRACAIHWHWTTEATNAEIGDALGVTEQTIEKYLSDGPGEQVREKMGEVESEVRMVAVAELQQQLKQAGERSRSATKPVKVYETDTGDVETIRIEFEDGEKLIPKVQDIQMLPDGETRYYARDEVRSIIDQLTNLVGAGEPEQHELMGEGGGAVEVEITNQVVTTDGDG